MARVVETSWPAGGGADLVAQPTPGKARRSAPNPKPFSFRSDPGQIAANLGALLFLATPPSVLKTMFFRCSRYLLGRLGSEMRKVQGLSAVAASGSASAGGAVDMSMSGARRRRSQHTDAASDDALDWLSGFRVFRKGGVFDTLFELEALRGPPPLGGNRFVDVSRHKEVMSCGRSITRIVVVAMHASGVHLQPIGCGFTRLL